MSCEDIVLMLSEYHNEQLTAEEHQQVKDHLEGCESCRQELAQTQDLQAVLQFGQPVMAEATQEQVITRIMEAIVEPPATLSWEQRLMAWFKHNSQLVMACSILVMGVAITPFAIQHYKNTGAYQEMSMVSSEPSMGGEGRSRMDSDGTNTPVPMAMAPAGSLAQPSVQAAKEKSLGDRGAATSVLGEAELAKKNEAPRRSADENDSLALEETKQDKQSFKMAQTRPATIVAPPTPKPAALVNQSNYASFLIRQGTLSLEVKQVDQAFRSIEDIVDKSQGYIVSATLNQPDEGRANADIQLKVPRKFMTQVTAELEALGSVRQKTLRSEDIWLNYQQQQIEIEHTQGQLNQTTQPTDRLALQKQIKQEKIERLRLQQMLNMSTLDLHLSETAVSQIWDMQQTWESILQQLVRSGRETLLMLTAVVAFIPPLLVYILVGYIGIRLLKWLLVARLNILPERTLYTLAIMALVYFPLYWSNRRTSEAIFSFTLLAMLWWSGKTLLEWWRTRQQRKQQDTNGG